MPRVQSPHTGNWYDVPDEEPDFGVDPIGSPGLVRSPHTGSYYRVSDSEYQDFLPRPIERAPQAPSMSDAESGVELSDYLSLYMRGSAGLGRSLNALIEHSPLGSMVKALGVDPFRAVDELASSAVDYWSEQLSPAMQDELAKQFVTKNAFGEYEWGGAGLTTALGMIAESAPGTMLGAGIGAGLARVVQAFANPIGRSVLVQRATQLRGAGVADNVNQALKKLRLVDKAIGAASFGASEGLIGGAQGFINVYDQVQKMDPGKLAQNERYQQVYHSTDEAMDPLQKHQYAAEVVAREAASVAGVQSGLTTALLGAPMGAFFGSLLGRSQIGRLASARGRAAATGAAGEALQEAAQSGSEQVLANRALIEAGDTERDLFEDVANAMVGGAGAGGIMGGGLGAAAFSPRDAAVSRETFTEEDLERVGRPTLALEGPPGSVRPPADFEVGAEGVARRPGEELPEVRALPPPGPSGRIVVDREGVAREEPDADFREVERRRGELVDLGMAPLRVPSAGPQQPAAQPSRFEEREGEGPKFRAARLKRFLHTEISPGPEVDPKTLPPETDAYFTPAAEGNLELPIAKLRSDDREHGDGGSTQEASRRALKYFAAGIAGRAPKRGPLDVRAMADGTYQVIDGQATLGALKQIPKAAGARVRVVDLEVREEAGDPKATARFRKFVQQLDPEQRAELVRMREDATTFRPTYDAGMAEAAKAAGATFKPGGLKSDPGWGRIAEKTVADNGGWAGKLKDFIRGTIIVETQEQARAARDAVIAKFGVAEGTKVRETLLAQSEAEILREDSSGYADIKINVPGPNGRIYEVQIATQAFLDAKKAGHKQYELVRSIDARVADRVRAKLPKGQELTKEQLAAAIAGAITPMEARQRAEALKRSREVYAAPLRALLARSSSASNSASVISEPSSSTEKAVTEAQPDSGKNLAAPRESRLSTAGSPSTLKNVSGPSTGSVLPSATDAPVRVQSVAPPTPRSNKQKVITSAGREFETEYVLAEAADLVTSDMAEFPQELQPRQRTRAAAKAQVDNMARNLKPELLVVRSARAGGGPPIVDDSGRIVESGNGRIMAIRQAYQDNLPSAVAYRAELEAQGYQVGDMKAPVLVRRRTGAMSMEERRAFTVEANTGNMLKMSPAEQAAADAQLLDGALLDLMKAGSELNSLANVPFIRGFMGRLAVGERNALVGSDGTVSQEGLRRVQAALLARAYGGSEASNRVLARALESTDDNVKSITAALIEVAPDFARLRQSIEDGVVAPRYALNDHLLPAVEVVANVRAAGRSIEETLRQGDFYGDMAPERESIIRLFYNRPLTMAAGKDKIAASLRYYATEAMKQRTDQASLLAGKPPTPDEILRAALDRTQPPERPMRAQRLAFSRSGLTGWFGASKVVNADGSPKVVYHGTNQDVRRFEQGRRGSATGSKSAQGAFWFTDSPVVADTYAEIQSRSTQAMFQRAMRLTARAERAQEQGHAAEALEFFRQAATLRERANDIYLEQGEQAVTDGANVMPVFLKIENPYLVDADGEHYSDSRFSEHLEAAKRGGHDGVIVSNVTDAADSNVNVRNTVYAVFAPTQIKSALGNRGAFSPTDPRLLMRTGGAPAPTTEVQTAVRAALEGAIAKISHLVDARVVDSIDELTPQLGLLPGDMEGAYLMDGRTVVFVTGGIKDAARAEQVFAHEVLGHLAMERSPELAKAINMVHTMRGMKNRAVVEIWNEVAARQPLLDRTAHAKEVIAVMAERGVKSSIIDRLMQAVRDLLRAWGLSLQPTDQELRNLIAKAARDFMAGRTPAAVQGLSAASTDAAIIAALDRLPPSPEIDGAFFIERELEFLRGMGEERPPWADERIQELEAAVDSRDRFGSWLDVQGGLEPSAAQRQLEAKSFAWSRAPMGPDDRQANFRAWFGASKVVNHRGEPLRLFHGMPQPFQGEAFDQDGGVYATPDPSYADEFAETYSVGGGNVLPIFMRVEKPMDLRGFGVRAVTIEEFVTAMREQGLPKDAADALEESLFEYVGDNKERNQAWAWVRIAYRPIREALAAQGFDGLVQREENGRRQADAWLAFSNRQVKSAVGNAGTFSRQSENILFSRAAAASPELAAAMDRVLAPAPESLTIRDKARNLWTRLRNVEMLTVKQGMVDQFASIEAYERSANEGKLQDASASAYKATLATKNLSSVMAAVMIRGVPEYRQGAFQPVEGRKGVLEIFRPLMTHPDGNLLRQWEFFAAANRARRLKAEQNRDGTSREKLFTDAEIELGLSLERKYPEFRQVLTEWAAFNKQTLDLAEEAGIIDPESRAIWERNDYVPFYRAVEEFQGPGKRRSLEGQRARIKTLEGSEAQLGNVFENMMLNTAHLIDASFKNRAMQRVVALTEGAGMHKVELPWQAVKVSNAQLATALRNAGLIVGNENEAGEVVDRMTKDQREAWSTLFRRVAPRGPNIVSLMVDGKPEYYEVEDPLLLRAVTGMGQDRFDGLAALFFRGSKRLLTTAVTTDPAFMLANFVRDTLSTWVISDASMKPVVDAVRGLKATWTEDETLVKMMMAGAGGGGYYDSNPEDIRKLVSGKLEASKVENFMRSIVTPKSAWRVWRKIGASFENANRVAVFRAVLAKGGSLAEAAYQARDVLNFSMRGDFGAMRWLTETVPFLNARVQGLYRLWRGARDNRRGFMMKGTALLAATMALALANEDEPEYEELPEWDKDLYWHFFVGGEHYRLPKPFEVGAMFATIPERAWRGLSGRDSGRLVWERIWAMAADTFAFNPVPQLVRPVIEQYANRTFFTGSPIVGMAEQGLEPEAQFTPWTSETMRELAQAMPDWAPEWIRSPRRLEAAVRGYTGSVGMYVVGISDHLVREAFGYPESPGQRIYDYPVVARFWRDKNPRYTKYADQMYDMLQEANATFSTINRFRREQRFEEAKALFEENRGKLMVRARLNRLASQVRRINEQVRIVQANRSMTAEQKRMRVDSLVARKNEITRQVAPLADLF